MKLLALILLLVVAFSVAVEVFEGMGDIEEMMDSLKNPCVYCHFLYRDCLSVSFFWGFSLASLT